MVRFDIAKIEEVVRKAGLFALGYVGKVEDQGKQLDSHAFKSKEQEAEKLAFSFVDSTVQKMVMEGLLALYPDTLGIVAEESSEEITELCKRCTHVNAFPKDGYTIVLDPIDGTKNYLSATPSSGDHKALEYRRNLWCVSLSIFKGCEAILGVMHFPALGRGVSLVTEKGKGTFIAGKQVHVEQGTMCLPDDFVKISPPLKVERPVLAERFPSDADLWPGCYTAAMLALFKGTAIEKIPELEAEQGLIRYKSTVSKNVAVYDLACSALAWREAGGLVSDEKGDPINPAAFCSFDGKKDALVIKDIFLMAPNQKYLSTLLEKMKGVEKS